MNESYKKAVAESARARSERALLNFEKQGKKCLRCGKHLTFKQRKNKFCSKSCSISYNNTGRISPLSKNKKCKSCGNSIPNERVYCSTCISLGLHKVKVKNLEDAKSSESRRKILINIRGNKCEECGLSEWRGKKLTIQMHHIDGNPDNNIAENLILLCPNCHSVTPNFGIKNQVAHNTSRNRKRRNLYHTGHFKDD